MSDITKASTEGTNRRTGDGILDPKAAVGITMTLEEHENHEGNVWLFYLLKDGVAQNGTVDIQIDTGANEWHLQRLRWWANCAKGKGEIIEAPDLTTGDNAVPFINRNRNGAHLLPDDIKLWDNPTVVSGGTILEAGYFGAGAGVGAGFQGAAGEIENEILLLRNATTIIRLTNLENNLRDFSISGLLYLGEHED